MTTVAALIERARRHLYTDTRGELNRLSGSVLADATSLTFGFPVGGIQTGALLAVDLEEYHVWSSSSNGAVVQPGMNGSTSAAHADETLVYVNPKFSAFSILGALNDELTSLSAPGSLYRAATVELTYDSGTDAYDLTGATDVYGVLSVDYNANDGTERWATLPRSNWRLRKDQNTSEFPSGVSITVNGYVESGQPMRVTYATGFTPALAASSDVVETVSGIPSTAVDILPIGAAIRLTLGTEIARNFTDQGETRRAGEVPPGARGSAMRGLIALRQTRIAEESARLYALRPVQR